MITRAKRAENSFQALNQAALASPVMLDDLGILEPWEAVINRAKRFIKTIAT